MVLQKNNFKAEKVLNIIKETAESLSSLGCAGWGFVL